MQRCKQAESKHKAEIETDKLKIEQLKQEKNEKKKVVDQMEEETAKVKSAGDGEIKSQLLNHRIFITGPARCSRIGERVAQYQLRHFYD